MTRLNIVNPSATFGLIIALVCPSFGCGTMDMTDDTGGPDQPDAMSDDPTGPEIGPLGPGVVTLAGAARPGDADGTRGEALFNNPVNVAVSPTGDIFVADFDNSLIRRVAADGAVTTVAIDDSGFGRPFGLTFASGAELYIQTDYNASGAPGGALWVLDPGTETIELVVDNIGKTRGIAALPDGRLIGTNSIDHVLLLIDPATGTISQLAGSIGQASHQDGVGSAARFHTPSDVLLIEPEAVLVADRGNHRLRRVTVAGEVTTVAGTGEAMVRGGSIDTAAFNAPHALARDAAGTIYISSLDGYAIQRMTGDDVETLAGDGVPGFRDDTENPLAAQFFGLEGIAVSPAGDYLYVADGNRGEDGPYHRIRRVSL